MTDQPDVPSPCINVCQIDRRTGWCIGCWRTGAEIGAWPTLDNPGRHALLAELPGRKERYIAASAREASR